MWAQAKTAKANEIGLWTTRHLVTVSNVRLSQ
jgi:hypothetical protein